MAREACGDGTWIPSEASEHDRPGRTGYGVGIVPHGTSEPPRRGFARISILVIVLALVGLFIWSEKHLTNSYAISPGLSQPVGPLIRVSGHPHRATKKSILLTDVYFTQLTSWQWFLDWIHPPAHTEIVGGLLPSNVPTPELYTQAFLDMYDSQSFAKVAALRALHLRVTGAGAGAAVYQVDKGAPSEHDLSVADRIVWARGHTVSSFCSLLDALSGGVAGRPVALKVRFAQFAPDGTILGYGPPKPLLTPTGPLPPEQNPSGCAGNPQQGLPGVKFEDAYQWHFPFAVSINTAGIGGPSAGLSMTLGIIDALSKSSITGNLKIAATGTIDPNGNVGTIGGDAEKTISVENAGATVFLVPSRNFALAHKTASAGLTVVAVDTLSEALAAIQRLGGAAPVPIAGPTASLSSRA